MNDIEEILRTLTPEGALELERKQHTKAEAVHTLKAESAAGELLALNLDKADLERIAVKAFVGWLKIVDRQTELGKRYLEATKRGGAELWHLESEITKCADAGARLTAVTN